MSRNHLGSTSGYSPKTVRKVISISRASSDHWAMPGTTLSSKSKDYPWVVSSRDKAVTSLTFHLVECHMHCYPYVNVQKLEWLSFPVNRRQSQQKIRIATTTTSLSFPLHNRLYYLWPMLCPSSLSWWLHSSYTLLGTWGKSSKNKWRRRTWSFGSSVSIDTNGISL